MESARVCAKYGFLFAVGAAFSCKAPVNLEKDGTFNKWLATAVHDTGMRNAILAQQTLYPYHFREDSAVLNDLGRSDLAALAEHYRIHPGELGVRRGSARTEVYDARLKTVKDLLADAGVDPARMKISDSLAGGDGMASERALRVLERSYEVEKAGASRRRDGESGSQRSGGGGNTGGQSRTGGR